MKKLFILLLAQLPLFALAQTAEECFEKGKQSYDSKNYVEAYKWFKQSADQGNPKGQNGLANLYIDGYGVNKDVKKAIELYKLSAGQGYVKAQSNLGYVYLNGEGVDKDYAEALKWYSKAAEQGYAEAQNELGICMKQGKEFPKTTVNL